MGSEGAIFLSFYHPCTLLIIVFFQKILHFKQITETTFFVATTHLLESFRLLFFVGLGQLAGMDAATPKISILFNAIIISVADVIRRCLLFRCSCLRRGSYSGCALMLLHLVLEEPSPLFIARRHYFSRARILALEKRHFVMQRCVTKLDCRFTADALASQ